MCTEGLLCTRHHVSKILTGYNRGKSVITETVVTVGNIM